MATTTSTTVNLTSFSNTPQAKDDSLYGTTESLLDSGSLSFTLDVMANDLGGMAKTLYSVDDGLGSTSNILNDLAVSDLTNSSAAADGYTAKGAKLQIVNGKVVVTADAAYRALAGATGAGETFTDTFVYAIQLGNGTLSWARVTFTIAGSNDAPIITAAVATGGVTEDASATTLSTTGTITFDDVDTTDGHTVAVANGAGNTLGGTLAATITDTATGAGDGTVSWSYSVANSATQYLGMVCTTPAKSRVDA